MGLSPHEIQTFYVLSFVFTSFDMCLLFDLVYSLNARSKLKTFYALSFVFTGFNSCLLFDVVYSLNARSTSYRISKIAKYRTL